MAEANFRLPPSLDITDGNVAENYKKWRRQMDIYLIASGATTKDKAIQTAIILHCAGPQVLELYDHFTFAADDDKDDPKILLEKLKEYCNPRQNEVIQSHRFWNVQWQEPFDVFLTELRTRAEDCNFQAQKERMIRDKVVFTVSGKLQERLLREDKLDLKKTIEICRAFEQSSQYVKEFGATKVSQAINNVKHDSTRDVRDTARSMGNQKHEKRDCNFCGYKHELVRTRCPAWGKICSHCKEKRKKPLQGKMQESA